MILASLQLWVLMSILSLYLYEQMETLPHVAATYMINLLEAHMSDQQPNHATQGGQRIDFNYLAGL
jgi:hypothetical protein